MGEIGTCLHYINKSFNVVIEKNIKNKKKKINIYRVLLPIYQVLWRTL